MKAYKKKGWKISKEEKKDIEEQKQIIIEMILTKDLKAIDEKFTNIMDNLDKFHPCIQTLMNKMIILIFDDFFWYLKVDGVEMTSNTSKLNFQKSMPKHVKRRMGEEDGALKRIYLKNEYRNRKLEK